MSSDGLERFKNAQKTDYPTALSEIRSDRKRSHWMWYIFPQIHGLGHTGISQYYSIQSLEEAKNYVHDPVLGSRLSEISNALLELKTSDPHRVFGSPDDPVFGKVLDKFYDGMRDKRTLEILKEEKNEAPPELTDREIYDTPIGPVCMSKTEYEAYLEELEIRKLNKK